MKSVMSASNFNRTSKEDEVINSEAHLTEIYCGKQVRERSKSKAEKRAKTPKANRVIVPIDEKTEEDLEKEIKAKREAADKIKKRQDKYLSDI
jgi:predicted nucleic acid-binding protein